MNLYEMNEKKNEIITNPIEVFAQNAICLYGSSKIYIDPFGIPDEPHDADFLFITHPHWDHFSLIDVLKVKKKDTNFVVPKEIFEELLDIGILEEHILIVKPNEQYHFANMSFSTIPAYNVDKEYHLKENNWVGFLITMDQVIYYIAGDTDITEENRKVKADVIFLPVGGTYTMNAKEAAKLANIIHPHLAIPTHYESVVGSVDDAYTFCKLVDCSIATKIFYFEKQD